MKILIEAGESAAYHYRLGWVNAFATAGHHVNFWNYKQKPAFDVFSEFEPDVFIGTTWNLNRAVIKCIQNRPNLKILLSAPNWGDIDESIDPEDTVQFATQTEKDNLAKLKELTGKPDYVMTYYHQNWIDRTHNHYRTLGIEPVGIPMGADITIYNVGTYKESLACDIAFVGNYWKYKGTNLNKYLVKYAHPTSPYKVRVYGTNWPIYNCVGEIGPKSLHMVKDIFRSAKICPAIYEPLSAKYGFDVSERVFKVCSSGGFCLSEHVESLVKDFDIPGVKTWQTDEEYEFLLNFYAKEQENQRLDDIGYSTKWVYKHHTYFHRTCRMMELLAFEQEGIQLLEIAKQAYDSYNL